MTAPTPDPTPAVVPVASVPVVVVPSQVRHPWRATGRTAIAVVIGAASTLPEVLATLHLDGSVLGGQAIAVTIGLTRVMALPKVNDLLTRLGLGAEPKSSVMTYGS